MKTLKKIPLVMILFWLSCGWFIIPAWILYSIGRLLLGYWKCESCDKWFWVHDEKQIHRKIDGYYAVTYQYCESCAKKEQEKYEELRKKLVPPKPPTNKVGEINGPILR